MKSYPRSYPHSMHAPRLNRATSRTNRRGTVSTDQATSQITPKKTVSPASPLQTGWNGIGTGTRAGEGVATANAPVERRLLVVYVLKSGPV